MTQAELEQAVADATGESLQTVRRRGFSIVQPLEVFDPDDACDPQPPQVIDWDAVPDRYARRAG